MGGFGSTRWDGIKTRRRVENCLAIAPPRTRRNPNVLEGGCWVWPRYDFSVVYSGRRGSSLVLTFSAGSRACVQTVVLDATPANLDGRRLWFLCPGCDRRSGRLYLPPPRQAFLCRLCHRLSYESAQASRASYYDLFRSRARHFGGTSRWVRELFREACGIPVAADRVGWLIPELGKEEALREAGGSEGKRCAKKRASEVQKPTPECRKSILRGRNRLSGAVDVVSGASAGLGFS